MKKSLLLVFSLAFLSSFAGNHLVSHTKILSLSLAEIEEHFTYYKIPDEGEELYGVEVYKINYITTEVNGTPIEASGAVFIPAIEDCGFLPMISWQHQTVFDKTNVASNRLGDALLGNIMSAYGYIVCSPDYLGLGDNEGIHPYHHGVSQATAALDLIRATREFLEEATELKDNNQLFITGYSQGGHATMAMHKYVQDNELYGEFNIVASAPLSGAYDLNGAQFDLIFDGDSTYYMSAFIPYLLGSYQLVYGDIYESYIDIYKSPFDEQVEILLNENHSWDVWTRIIPDNIYEFMQDSVIENMLADESRQQHPILKAMKENSYMDWIPERPVRMVYVGQDSMVSPQNAVNTYNRMTELGAGDVEAINVDSEGTHENGLFLQMVYAKNWFESIKQPCQMVTHADDMEANEKFSVYPNPASKFLNINYPKKIVLSIFDMNGQKLILTETGANGQIDISGLPGGRYIVVGIDPEKNIYLTSQFIAL